MSLGRAWSTSISEGDASPARSGHWSGCQSWARLKALAQWMKHSSA